MRNSGQRPAPVYVFGTFRLDEADQRLWRQDEPVPLGRKALSVLHCLLSRAGRLVTKQELLAAAWPDTAVSDAVVTTAIRELRRALDDRAREPRFVETVHGSGYRFVAPVSSQPEIEPELPAAARPDATAGPQSRGNRPPEFVGRSEELDRLGQWLDGVRDGCRQIGFVAGEAGLGKTSLVDVFLGEVADDSGVHVARGQSVEHYGAGEAYLPLLEALARLGRDRSLPVLQVLRRYAPSWLPHLPSLLPAEEREATAPATAHKKMRELAEAVEVLTANAPLVLVLEDLHWSDTATLEWLAYAARRRDPARLLVIGTYRPVEALISQHPLRRVVAELRQQRLAVELLLDYLGEEEVMAYLRQRCPPLAGLQHLGEILHRRTGGHPLFLVTLVDELQRLDTLGGDLDRALSSRNLDEIGKMIPSSAKQFVEHRFELVSESDRQILEAASVAGSPFQVVAVAHATSRSEEEIEASCAAWSGQGRFLEPGDPPTSAVSPGTARFQFRHALFQEAIYSRIPPQRRARFHRLVGERLEQLYGERAPAIAAELAMHFDEGQAPQSAVAYREQAARNALERSAYSEARQHLVRGLELLERLPANRWRKDRELHLSLLLGQVLMSTRGWGVPEAAALYGRMRELCEELDDRSRLLSVIWGQMAVSVVRAELRETLALAEELLARSGEQGDTVFATAAHFELGGTSLLLGELERSSEHFMRAAAFYHPEHHPLHVERFGLDTGLFAHCWHTHQLWLAGHRERAIAQSDESLRWAEHLAHPFSRAVALAYAAMLRQLDGDTGRVEELSRTTIDHCFEHGFPYYLAWARVLHGWSRAVGASDPEGLDEIEQGLEVLEATAGVRLPYYRALKAEALGRHRRVGEALEVLAAALADVERTGESWWLAELHRLRGELLLVSAQGQEKAASTNFGAALAVASAQGARALEIRASTSRETQAGRSRRAEASSRRLGETPQR